MQVTRQTRFTVESTLVNLRARLSAIEAAGPGLGELQYTAEGASRTLAVPPPRHVTLASQQPQVELRPPVPPKSTPLPEPQPHAQPADRNTDAAVVASSGQTDDGRPSAPAVSVPHHAPAPGGHLYAPHGDLPASAPAPGSGQRSHSARDLPAAERQLLVDQIMRDQHFVVAAGLQDDGLERPTTTAQPATTSHAISHLFSSPIEKVPEDDHDASVQHPHAPQPAQLHSVPARGGAVPHRQPVASEPMVMAHQAPHQVTVSLQPGATPIPRAAPGGPTARTAPPLPIPAATASAAAVRPEDASRARSEPEEARRFSPRPHPPHHTTGHQVDTPKTRGGTSTAALIKVADRPGAASREDREAVIAAANAAYGAVVFAAGGGAQTPSPAVDAYPNATVNGAVLRALGTDVSLQSVDDVLREITRLSIAKPAVTSKP